MIKISKVKIIIKYIKIILGLIKSDDIRLAFMKLNLNISTNDIELMLKNFDITNQKDIDIQDFVKNLLSKYRSIEPNK